MNQTMLNNNHPTARNSLVLVTSLQACGLLLS